MASISRDVFTDEVIIRLGLVGIENDPRGIAEQVRNRVIEFLAEEFLKKYKEGILGAVNADDIAYKLNDAVAELIRRKLLGEPNV